MHLESGTQNPCPNDPMLFLAAEVQGIESRPLTQKLLVSQTCNNQASVVLIYLTSSVVAPTPARNLMFDVLACSVRPRLFCERPDGSSEKDLELVNNEYFGPCRLCMRKPSCV